MRFDKIPHAHAIGDELMIIHPCRSVTELQKSIDILDIRDYNKDTLTR